MRPPFVLIAILSLLLAACSAAAEQPSPSPSEAPATPIPTTSEEPTPTASESPAPEPTDEPSDAPQAGIPPDSVVATTVDRLILRRGPGTDAERIGFLSPDTIAYVVAGPTEADGFPWYHIAGMGLPYGSGCVTPPPDEPIGCPAFQGWVAGESQAGDAWLAPAALRCPDPTIGAMSELGFTHRLACWGDEEITFEAFWPELRQDGGPGGTCPQADEPAGFLYCQHTNPNALAATAEEGNAGVPRLFLSIDPASGLEMPARGQMVRVTGAFDHPAAAGCAEIAVDDHDPAAAAFHCRTEFVPTAVVPLEP
jgi:hypothetical protein